MLTQSEKDGRSWRAREELLQRASCELQLSLVWLFFGITHDERFFKRIGNDKPALPQEGGSDEPAIEGT